MVYTISEKANATIALNNTEIKKLMFLFICLFVCLSLISKVRCSCVSWLSGRRAVQPGNLIPALWIFSYLNDSSYNPKHSSLKVWSSSGTLTFSLSKTKSITFQRNLKMLPVKWKLERSFSCKRNLKVWPVNESSWWVHSIVTFCSLCLCFVFVELFLKFGQGNMAVKRLKVPLFFLIIYYYSIPQTMVFFKFLGM